MRSPDAMAARISGVTGRVAPPPEATAFFPPVGTFFTAAVGSP
jgi:hypothetical protein